MKTDKKISKIKAVVNNNSKAIDDLKATERIVLDALDEIILNRELIQDLVHRIGVSF